MQTLAEAPKQPTAVQNAVKGSGRYNKPVNRILKFTLTHGHNNFPATTKALHVKAPKGSLPLSVAYQHERWQLWAEVPNDATEEEDLVIFMVPTGGEIPRDNSIFLNTALSVSGTYIYHFYAAE